jgi:hypothetical protein
LIDKPPRRFHLVRHVDATGVSGTGVVAEGAEWSSGAVALHWPGHPRATSIWASIDDLKIAHGHEGQTEVRYLDAEVAPKPDLVKRDGRGWIQFDDSAVIELPDERRLHGPRD